MELRRLNSSIERLAFEDCLSRARAVHDDGFRELPTSQVGRAHLAFGRLYGLYHSAEDPADRMIAGFRCHDLSSLPQTHSRPDLTHSPGRSVLEYGQLWSLSKGAGRITSHIAGIVAGMLEAKVILVYPVLSPIDRASFYAPFGFEKAGEPLKCPYIETLDGREIWIQALMLTGARLNAYIRSSLEYVRSTSPHGQVIRLMSDLEIRCSTASERRFETRDIAESERPTAELGTL